MAEQIMSQTPANSARPAVRRRIAPQQMRGLLRSAALGDIVSVLMRAPRHKLMSLDALRGIVMPAVFHNQYMIARVRGGEAATTTAAGVALWASVSDEIDARLRSEPASRVKLAFNDWKSGPHLWLVDLIAPAPLGLSMLKDLDAKVAKGSPMRTQFSAGEDKMRVATISELIDRASKAGV